MPIGAQAVSLSANRRTLTGRGAASLRMPPQYAVQINVGGSGMTRAAERFSQPLIMRSTSHESYKDPGYRDWS